MRWTARRRFAIATAGSVALHGLVVALLIGFRPHQAPLRQKPPPIAVELRRRGSPGGHGNANLREEFLLSGRRADAEQSSRLPGGIGEEMRRVGRDA